MLLEDLLDRGPMLGRGNDNRWFRRSEAFAEKCPNGFHQLQLIAVELHPVLMHGHTLTPPTRNEVPSSQYFESPTQPCAQALPILVGPRRWRRGFRNLILSDRKS